MYENTVLIVEDHRDIREIYAAALRHSGYRVLEASDGGEGIQLARQHKPDLVVMDLGLPLVDGWEATEVLKADPETSHIPVVAVSVYVHDFYRGRAQVVGCDSFLCKPCEPTKLLGEITRLLSGS